MRHHLLAVAKGSYKESPLSAETWSCGIRLALVSGQVDERGTLPDNLKINDASDEVDELGYIFKSNFSIQRLSGNWDMAGYFNGNLVPAWKNLFSQAQISNVVTLEEIALYPIEEITGRASDGRSARAVLTPRALGTATGSMLPLEVARVLSWGTSRPGAKGKGRIYLPGATTTTVDPYGNMSGATQTALANNAKTLLQTLSAGSGVIETWNVRPIVCGAPYDRYAVINEVRVGSILDAQRRRRKSLDENYVRVIPSY